LSTISINDFFSLKLNPNETIEPRGREGRKEINGENPSYPFHHNATVSLRSWRLCGKRLSFL
jgi:hypothetical protein